MQRRRFLKYAGLGAAVAGAGLAGYEFDRWQTAAVPPSVSTVTQTRTLSETVTETLRLASLKGRLFFDYNGNGVQEAEEPAVAGALVQLKDSAGKVVAESLTDSSGDYKLEDVTTGSYKLRVGVDHFSDRRFRYMCRSTEEFTAIPEGYDILLDRSQSVDIGLMEGFLTLPFPRSVPIDVDPKRGDYFDHDPGLGAIWWEGTRLPAPRPHYPPNVHPEVDFFMPKGIEVKAAASGVIERNYLEAKPYFMDLLHKDGWRTSYVHIEKPLVPVGTKVRRGETIALSGDTGCEGTPATAFQLWKRMPDGTNYHVDQYSPMAGVPKGAWIHTRIGDWVWYPSDEEWISQGYWTKLNDPQYPST